MTAVSKKAEGFIAAGRAAIERGDLVAAITALPAAWRECRHPRIADLIDRVSAEVERAQGPIPGDTIKARCAAWHVIEEDRDPADVGRLLSIAWPGLGKLGWAIHRKIAKWPEDPRVPRMWIQLPRRGYADRAALWKQICVKVAAFGDQRILPELSKLALPRETRARLGALRAERPPALSPAIEEALSAMEQRYATDLHRERSLDRGEPEMLAAIFAAPDDLSVRDVYADWLIEHGDPRGELIALQRARSSGRSTPKSEQRERALLDEHGDRWAEPLTKLIEGRIFEDGFVAAGRLRPITGWRPAATGRSRRLDPKTKLPHWKLVRRLDVVGYDDLSLLLDDLPHLEGLYFVSTDAIKRLVRGPVRGLRELGSLETEALPLDPCPALSRLRALTLLTESSMVKRLPRGRLAAQLERVTLVGIAPKPALVEELLELPRLTELAMHGYDRTFFLPDPTLKPYGFELRIARDLAVRGAFHKSRSPAPFDAYKVVSRYLGTLPRDITSLVIEPSRALRFDDDQRREIEKIVAGFKKLSKLELPF
jgi:uncharacterized protein (TIGR02996 family)